MPNYTTNAPQIETKIHKYCSNKACERAGQLLPISDFYRDKYAPDGRTYQCKQCSTAKKYEYNRSEKGKESHKKYMQSEKGRAATARHEQSEKGKLGMRTRMARRRQMPSHGPKEAARHAVFAAVRSGILPRARTLPCIECRQPAKEYHHHLGYEPKHHLDVIPVCKACHVKIHHSATG